MRQQPTEPVLPVFGYASLAFEPGRPVELAGWRRVWNVAMDNSIDLPGYKYYVDAETGERPAVFVAFLNIEPDPSCAVNGCLFETRPEMLGELDRRERNYERVDMRLGEGERAWAYVGGAEARQRAQQALRAGKLVVDASYYASVRDYFAALGPGQLERFDATTEPPPGELLDLRRVDLPHTG